MGQWLLSSGLTLLLEKGDEWLPLASDIGVYFLLFFTWR
jgi:hypothetical protein